MRLSVAVFFVACISATLIGTTIPLTHAQDEDVRGAFLTSRPKDKPPASSTSSRPPSRRRPHTVASSDPKKPTPSPTPDASTSGSKSSTASSKSPSRVNSSRIGLGLTLFMRDSNGLAVRTDPDHVFRKGDRVRVLLETNIDGYLYIFNTTNDGPPVMIYPDADLDDAGNYLQAHVPFEIPSSQGTEERFRWLVFDQNAGDERLYFVLTREPLKGVPIEEDLVKMCRESQGNCPVHPGNEVWEAIKKDMSAPLKSDKSDTNGLAQTAAEQQATSRGIGLAKDDPQPSLIMMASSNSSTLVTSLALNHN